MAQLQQRVFLIFIRPCFVKKSSAVGYPNNITKYFGKIYRDTIGNELKPIVTQYKNTSSDPNSISGNLPHGYTVAIQIPELNAPVPTNANDPIGGGIERFYPDTKGRMPADVPMYSTPPFNENNWFASDPWMLHSTWTSFEECKNYVRFLVDLIGFDSILVSNAINLELELLPNK